ncbi:hypothetical protein OQJ05_09085 [Fluoribacter gormanii]|uniref:hypothetical protein n=1 Tax=Fluoribacter gormanii TaxID=464 RepID=UPI002244695B|nr:hypothetical protein [Fluoribacter gormanii]MCW8444201.1 hypothetical protein [Fluoribacter gormanii]
MTIKKSIQARQEALKKKKEAHIRTDPKVVQFHINQMKESLCKEAKEEKSC